MPYAIGDIKTHDTTGKWLWSSSIVVMSLYIGTLYVCLIVKWNSKNLKYKIKQKNSFKKGT